MKVLLTGATGFVGGRLALGLRDAANIDLSCAVREPGRAPSWGKEFVVSGLDSAADWSEALQDQELVIHAAARAHVMQEQTDDPLTEYRKVNVEGTLNLARQAAEAGVRRFIFLSSIKVNGESTPPNQPYLADSEPAPEDAYGISKHEAERGLQDIGRETGMELVVIRPPLVYGPGVKGNFASMIKLVERGVPLPFGSVHNRRSLVALDNLVDLVITCTGHPAAANETFLVSDGRDLSTTELLRGVGDAMGKSTRLFPVPPGLLMFAATVLGRKAMAQRLLGSLQVDILKAQELLGWRPPVSVEEGLRRCFVSEKEH